MDLMEMVSNVGFPIAVASFLLLKLVPAMNANTEVLKQIAQKLDVKE